ncbi:acyltransferase family protein [Lachnotalea glycerini]|uniref:Acyltransferase 3 domain-containing protein n=1 Tax=Lachnotalea glycerini TaxID=1763509 RepID=A0A371JGB7_9FIRM|nr:acyltransferase family protein [Lachnotalea glycerini]RDY31790.1 hypothetical protein CG710_008070 [Lachnotalea glycerini]
MNTQMQAKNRISWIDIAKAIGILFVLINHAELHLGIVTYLGGMFYMPVFFVLSGYTFKERQSETLLIFTKHKAKRLLIPYAFFQLLLVGMVTFKNIFAGQTLSNPALPFIGAIYSRNALYPNSSDVLVKVSNDNIHLMTAMNAPLWFLTGLFISLVMYKFILGLAKQNEKREYSYIGISMLIGIAFKYFCPILLPWSIDTAFIYVGFLHLGRILKRKNGLECLYHKPAVILGILLIFIGVSFMNGSGNLSIRDFGNSVLLNFAAGGFGVVCILLLSKAVEEHLTHLSCLLKSIGRHTIGILALHVLVFTLTEYVCFRFNLSGQVIEKVAKIVLSVVILVPIDWFIQKYLPLVYGIKRRNE